MNPRNPFYVLGVEHDASPGEIEREGRKLLGLFDVGAKKALTYTCPLGTFERDPTAVREAMTALRDPKRRVKEALLVALLAGVDPGGTDGADAPLEDAFLAGGYRGL